MIIDLAHEARFALGGLEVRPSTREVVAAGRSSLVEPRVMQVLVALARRQGEVVSRDDLIASCWAGRAVGEDAINRCIAALRRLAAAHGAFTVETVARVGYRLSGSAAPAGDTVAPVAAAAPSAEVVLAVLAFDNLSGDAGMDWFSDGVSEEILQTVARGSGLKVIGRGSSFQFRGPGKAAAGVGQALHATHVLDGSVRRSGERVRIAASLIECADETTIWTERFDRELSDVFALQDEIAAAVAQALAVAFAPAVTAEAVDPEAYSRYLQALELRNRGLLGGPTLPSVIALLDDACRRAPQFAGAWVFLALMQVEALRFNAPGRTPAISRPQVVASAQRALELDPRLGAAYQALASLEPFGRFAEREALHEKALAVAPNDPTVLANASLFFAEVGRIEEAVGYGRRAYELDPMFPWVANWYGTILDYAGRDSSDYWRRLCALWPENELILWGAICSSTTTRNWDRFDELVDAARRRGFDSPTIRGAIGWRRQLRAPGPAVRASVLEEARGRLERSGEVGLDTLGRLHALGLADEAFDLAAAASFEFMFDPDRPSPNGVNGPAVIFSTTLNGAMMRDPRFAGLCARLGLARYWAATERWPDCAEAVGDSYDFKAEIRRLAGEGPV